LKKQKLRFIINPFSGTGKQKEINLLIKTQLNTALFEYEIQYTKAARHAIELSSKATLDGIARVVVVGGDGSVNEVGAALIGSNTAMGILPAGSGNGLARHFNISTTLSKAIEVLNTGKCISMDTFTVNNKPFLGTAGIGFDAHIAHLFANYGKRGFWSYLRIIWKELSTYKPATYQLSIDGKKMERQAFLICIANSSQFGNNAVIAPEANVQDGMMEVCILKKTSIAAFIPLVMRLFTRSIHKSNLVETIRCKSLVVHNNSKGLIHLDGEPMLLQEVLTFEIRPASLKIIVPVGYPEF
jgi:diacylglycerol kinase (ATP)